MRILLIEDEAPLAQMVKMGLEKARYTVDWCANGSDGFQRLCQEHFDLVVLDLMLPGMDGWTLCRRMRDRRDLTPVLMLTARDEVEDRVRGLELGADDYLPKPFAFPELRARIAALLRRDQIHRRRVIRIADLEIDTSAQRVRRSGRTINLTPREYDLLVALAGHEGDILTREMIQERIWQDCDSISNTVEVHIASLRRKIDVGDAERLIHTVHRRGYTLRRASDPQP